VRKPTTSIVSTGPYRFTRNPIYLSMTLLAVGIAVLANTIWILVMLAPVLFVMQFLVIAREESYLTRKFGEEYLRYKSKVRRWI
jgi:protein-S-isoprenylcysteine O-methyltransferase Ste14